MEIKLKKIISCDNYSCIFMARLLIALIFIES